MKYDKYYPERIELEALDRRLKADVQRFAAKGDMDGVEIAQHARQECQNRMLQITLELENK